MLRDNVVFTLLAFAGLGLTTRHTAADNWPRFRGPQATGVAPDHATLPEVWSKTTNVAWSANVPGLGWSNPIVWGERVFVTTVVGDEENTPPQKGLYLGQGVREPAKGVHHWLVKCFDLSTGKELWTQQAHTGRPTVPRHPKSSYAAETPTTDGERLYVLFGDLGLFCYSLEGDLLWKYMIEPKHTFFDYGAAASPVVHDGQVFVVYDNMQESWIAAIDAATGQERWKRPRDETHSWATPFIWHNESRTELVVPGQKRNRSYSLAGDVLWEFDGNMSNLVIPSPFAAHGMCYIAAGYVGDPNRPTFAIKPGASGDLTPQDDAEFTDNPYIAWHQPKSSPYNTSQIVYGDYLYTLFDQGFITCHNAVTGEEVYGKQRFSPSGSFTASPWAYNGYIFCLSEDGLTYVVQAGPEYKLVTTNPLEELCLATPAITGDRLLIRTASQLYCITGGPRAGAVDGNAKPEVSPESSQSWREFRGPNGSGVAIGCNPPVQIDSATATWKVPILPGHSSPVLNNDLVFLTAMDQKRFVTCAYRKTTGELVWQQAAPEVELEPIHESSSHATSTPYVDVDRLYVYFGSHGLLCYNFAGELLWQRPLPTPKSLYGTATSPVVYGNHVILVVDNDANMDDSTLSASRIVVFDRQTGEQVFEVPRPLCRSGWSTPTLWHHSQGSELVVLGTGRLCGYDLATGEEKWCATGFSRETIARPIVVGDTVFAAAAMLGGVADEQPDVEPFWSALLHFDTNADGQLERSEMTGTFTFPFRPDLPVDHPGFGLPLPSDPERRAQRLDGMFAGIDKDKDGYWSKKEFLNNLSFNRGKPHLMAVKPGGTGDITESHTKWDLHRGIPEIPTPLAANGRVYLVSDGGVLTVVDADNGRVTDRQRLGVAGHYRASPVLANNHLYLLAELGGLTVVNVASTPEVVHQYDFAQRIAATPAIDENSLYIRTDGFLYAFRSEH
jgi:outer membrane protein assembly factor BamB